MLAALRIGVMPIVFSHRGNLVGPSATTENRLPTVRAALGCNWGLETDIRRAADGRFYISHDPLSAPDASLLAEGFFEAIRAFPNAVLALNVKELGYEDALVAFLEAQGVLAQTFLFDMELLEATPGSTAQRFRRLDSTIKLAARISDRGEPIERALAIEVASVIWLDEFDGPHFTQHDVRRLKKAGRTVYAVSPDLHQAPPDETRARWMHFIRWGVDGICTDYPAALTCVLKNSDRETAA